MFDMPALDTTTGDIVKLWMQTAKLLRKRVFFSAGKTAVNPQQQFALMIISEHDGITMNELARELGITSPSATSLVNRLVRVKWVSRVADPENRRLVRLKMALPGRTMMEAVLKERAKAMQEVLSLLSPRDRTDFARILFNLHHVLHDGVARR
jgi:DNA-binding MarR family transcriptional regulator